MAQVTQKEALKANWVCFVLIYINFGLGNCQNIETSLSLDSKSGARASPYILLSHQNLVHHQGATTILIPRQLIIQGELNQSPNMCALLTDYRWVSHLYFNLPTLSHIVIILLGANVRDKP